MKKLKKGTKIRANLGDEPGRIIKRGVRYLVEWNSTSTRHWVEPDDIRKEGKEKPKPKLSPATALETVEAAIRKQNVRRTNASRSGAVGNRRRTTP